MRSRLSLSILTLFVLMTASVQADGANQADGVKAQLARHGFSEENDRLVAAEAKLVKEIENAAGEVPAGGTVKEASLSKGEVSSKAVIKQESSRIEKKGEDKVADRNDGKKASTVKAPEKPVTARAVAPQAATVKDPSAHLIELVDLQKTNMSLVEALNGRDQRVQQLQRELEETRGRLIIAETEVERLSNRLAAKNRSSLSSYMGSSAPGTDRAVAPSLAVRQAVPAPRRLAPVAQPVEADMPVVTVIKDKVALRTGPGMENSPLMEVSRGTRLTVETRNGKWYRVNTPNGTRAWVLGEVVQFGETASGASSTLRHGAYDTSTEDEALKLIKQGAK